MARKEISKQHLEQSYYLVSEKEILTKVIDKNDRAYYDDLNLW